VFAEVPPRVEYSLTERGLTLKPVVEALMDWGVEHGRSIVNERAARESQTL
jgi:DNA-binding HxlR family transcriptional regulator